MISTTGHPITRRIRRRGAAVAAVVLLVAGPMTLAACGGHGHENSAVSPDARVITVTGENLFFAPPEITVRKGEPVAIALTSVDVAHDLNIDAFGGHVYAEAGQTAEGGFTADETGTFEYYCSISGHAEAGMVGTLIVTD
jgi:heme/copper-type cytochrome/quinol oxidase subunit 2